MMFANPPRWTWTSSHPLAPWKSIPGYPKERHSFADVLVTFQVVLIVPAAPCCAAILIATELFEQSGTGVGAVEVAGGAVVVVVPGLVAADALDVVAVGTGPASWAPLVLHPARTRTIAMAKLVRSALVMRSIVRSACNASWPAS